METVVSEIVWKCCEKTFTQKELTAHLQEVHELELPLTGSRRMVQHLDGKKWYQSVFEWKFGDLSLVQVITAKRSKQEQKMWG